MNTPPSPFPLAEFSSKLEDHHPLLQFPFLPPHQQPPYSASPSLPCSPLPLYSNQQDQFIATSTNSTADSQHHDELKLISMNNDGDDHHKGRSAAEDEDRIGNGSKWMSSKMRLIQKMKNNSDCKRSAAASNINGADHHMIRSSSSISSSSSTTSSSTIRVCSDCHTTKTPLWRSGPQGPKSLCNACGIRQRKARRAAMAAAAVASEGGGVHASDRILSMPMGTNKLKVVRKKEKRSTRKRNNERFKKQIHSRGSKELLFNNFALSLSKNSAFRRVFPRDEEEAAVLLMALSCGALA